MLKTVLLNEQLKNVKGATLVLGGFDGLHFGHKKLVEKARSFGLPVGIMTIFGGKTEGFLYTKLEREKIFKDAGIDFVFEMQFDEIKDLSRQAFTDILIKEFSPIYFVCGEDFRFGKDALGTPAFLRESTQVCVEVCALEKINGQKVSSRMVRELLKNGEVEQANTLLSGEFSLVGEVVNGRKIGRTIGFPTANIVYPNEKCKIAFGVYQTKVEVAGTIYNGITNYGARPTFDDENVLTETYLDGFHGDLYGKTLKIDFVRYLRSVQKFENVERLKEQLTEDIRRIRGND